MPLLPKQSNEPPLWREEFSVLAADERYVSRRQFTKFLTLTSLAMFVGNCWILARSWLRRPASSVAPRVIARAGEIPVGGVKVFQFPTREEQCLLVRTAEDAYVAYSQKCTHLSCAVIYSAENKRLECPCHNGYFSIKDGSVLQGPPTRPLPHVVLERRGDELIATRMEERPET